MMSFLFGNQTFSTCVNGYTVSPATTRAIGASNERIARSLIQPTVAPTPNLTLSFLNYYGTASFSTDATKVSISIGCTVRKSITSTE